jgi:hypothetical protein
MKIRSLLSCITVLASCALPALAAEAPTTPAPSLEYGQLAFFAGEWSCTGNTDQSPMGPAHATTATVRVKKEMEGFWYSGYYDERKTADNPHPMHFAFFWGYDSAAKVFTLDGFDSMGSRFHETAAGWQDGKLVFDGTSAGKGPPTPFRDTFTRKDNATLEHSGEMQVEGKWVHLDQETCRKAKK